MAGGYRSPPTRATPAADPEAAQPAKIVETQTQDGQGGKILVIRY